MVWNILFFLLGVFGGVTLMSIMWVYDIANDFDDYDYTEYSEEINKHIPRID